MTRNDFFSRYASARQVTVYVCPLIAAEQASTSRRGLMPCSLENLRRVCRHLLSPLPLPANAETLIETALPPLRRESPDGPIAVAGARLLGPSLGNPRVLLPESAWNMIRRAQSRTLSVGLYEPRRGGPAALSWQPEMNVCTTFDRESLSPEELLHLLGCL